MAGRAIGVVNKAPLRAARISDQFRSFAKKGGVGDCILSCMLIKRILIINNTCLSYCSATAPIGNAVAIELG
jgi:hypothetical protein